MIAKRPGETGFKFWWHKMATRDARLTPAQYRVLMAVWDASDQDGREAYPGREKIAKNSACGSRTVDRALPVLVEFGYLVVEDKGGRGKGGRGLATVYSLGIPAHWNEETPANVTDVDNSETPANQSQTPAIVTETPANESGNPRHGGGPIKSFSNPESNPASMASSPTSPGEPVPDAMPVDPEEEEDMWSVPYAEPEAYSFAS